MVVQLLVLFKLQEHHIKFRTYDGSIIKSYDLAENESIYDLAFSDHNTKLIVTITCDDGTERTDIIDL